MRRLPLIAFARLLPRCAVGVGSAGLVLAPSFALAAAPGPAARLAFDIPAGPAAETLKRAANFAGVEIAFLADNVRGVRTQAVQGQLTLRAALERMVANTGLVVVEEPKSGLLSIGRRPASGRQSRAPPDSRAPSTADPPRVAPTTDQTSQHSEPTSMKRSSFLTLLAGWIVAGAHAQTAPASSATDSKNEEALVLSPFTVSTEKDTGYAATNTLVGTRLNTPVKDLGASLSIYTKDFIRDIGVTNANDLLIYATGMEALGASGNYSGATNDINAVNFVGEAGRREPQNATRTRGLASPNLTADLFGTSVPLDTYNTESVSVIRGPNAVLFGAGSPAGVIENTLIRPLLTRDQNRVETRLGNNESFRASLDLNRVLLPGKLAFRLATVYDENRFNQRPAFENKKRVFAAVTYQPTRSTVLRANFENGQTKANRPVSVLPQKSFTDQWIAAGQPVMDWRLYDDPALNPNAATQTPEQFRPGTITTGGVNNDSIAIVYNRSGDAAPAYAFVTSMSPTTVNAAYRVRANLFHPVVNRDSASDDVRFYSTTALQDLPASAWPGGIVPAGLKWQGFTDLNAFDWRRRQMDESGRQGDTFHTFNVTLEQRALRDHVGVELSLFSQRFNYRSKNPMLTSPNSAHLRIDTTVTLPDGRPNPNIGRPFYAFGQSNFYNYNTERETRRATVFARYDFKELSPTWGKWLGRHTVTGLLEEAANQTLNVIYRMRLTGDLIDTIEPNNLAGFQHRAPIMIYVGDSVLGGKPLRLDSVRIPEITNQLVVPAFPIFNAPQGSAAQGDLVSGTTSITEILAGGAAFRDVVRGQAAVLQSNWLDDHLVTIAGLRRDDDFYQSNVVNYNPAQPNKIFYAPGEFKYPRLPNRRTGAQTKSVSAVLRWPQKLVRLPAGSDLSVFVNTSDNFNPSSTRVDVFATPLDSPQGRTKEYGLNFSLFREQLSLRVNRFETRVQGQSFTSSAYNPAYNQATFGFATAWERERNTNPTINRSADIELLFSKLPANFRSLYQYTVTGSAAAGNIAASANTQAVANVNDTTDFKARGTEFELVYNPTRNWRILANVANQGTVQSNTAPNTKAYVALMQPVWDALADRPSGNYPTGYVPGTPLPSNVQTVGQYVLANITTPLATIRATEGSNTAEQRKWRANFVTNYTFSREGRLAGWSVGGAVRWQDKLAIGYPAKYVTAANGLSRSVSLDIDHPFYAKAETAVDSWVGYGRRILNKRIQWNAKLSVMNAIADQSLIPITAQPWGDVATTRIPPERRWYLTNTFEF